MADVYLKLFHGRNTIDEELEDWGFDGPILGPFEYVHMTYMSEIKFSMELEAYKLAFPENFATWQKGVTYTHEAGGRQWVEGHLMTPSNLVEYQGKFYGDCSVNTSANDEPPPAMFIDLHVNDRFYGILNTLCNKTDHEIMALTEYLKGKPYTAEIHVLSKHAELFEALDKARWIGKEIADLQKKYPRTVNKKD